MNKYNDESRQLHYQVMYNLLMYINSLTDDFVLKGGTALLMCYNLSRFSEDIDFNSTNKNIEKYIDEYCRKNNFNFVLSKDTNTTKRFKIHYCNDERYLKVEVSYRNKYIDKQKVCKINGITVYNINELAIQKTSAYNQRDKIRDLFDICFICNNYWNELSQDTKSMIENAVEYKGIEQYDYITRDQSDELIDNEMLLVDFLKICDKFGLINDEERLMEQKKFDFDPSDDFGS